MITVKIGKNQAHQNLDSALKTYKKTLEKLGIIKQLQRKKKYIKPALKNKLLKSKTAFLKKIRCQDI